MGRIIIETCSDKALRIANDMKQMRKRQKISQQELAKRSGISYGSIKRFEQTGQISFVSLLEIANVLNRLEECEKIFKEEIKYRNIDEVINSWKK